MALFQKFDKDCSGELDLSEFSKMIKRIDKELGDQEVESAFNMFDRRKVKMISFEDFKTTLNVSTS